MTLTCSTNKLLVALVAIIISANSFAQITAGRVVFERRTNLKKTLKGNKRAEGFINDKNKIRKEDFELLFNESGSVFKFIEPDVPEEGFMKYMTQRNTVHQNLADDETMVIMNLWGSNAFMKDSASTRTWKITNKTREFDGYKCTRAIWEMNDSTRIYAWFSPDIVPVSGPEGFHGLPGMILGLATEDGSIVYFAKEVEVMDVSDEMVAYPSTKEEIYNKEELKAVLLEKMGRWIKPEDLEAMFAWY
ncbi:MAG: GLPGLI family protein [Crocinitomicaceae bacterium]